MKKHYKSFNRENKIHRVKITSDRIRIKFKRIRNTAYKSPFPSLNHLGLGLSSSTFPTQPSSSSPLTSSHDFPVGTEQDLFYLM